MVLEEGLEMVFAYEQKVCRDAESVAVVLCVLVLVVDAKHGERGAADAVVLVAAEDVVDGQDELCADASRGLEHRVLFVVNKSGEVAALELCALDDFRGCCETAQAPHYGVGISGVGVAEVDVHGADLDVEHGAGAACGAEEEARADIADKGVGVAEELRIGEVCLHDFLADLAWEHDAHVA